MPNYRRAFVPGGTWFFTATLLDRRSRLLIERVDDLRAATRWTMQRRPFEIDAFVVLPDHLHAIWTLPPGDTDFSLRWRLVKQRFSRSMARGEPRSPVRRARGERVGCHRSASSLLRRQACRIVNLTVCYLFAFRRACDYMRLMVNRPPAR